MRATRKSLKGSATLEDVVRELGAISTQLELLKRLMAKFMIYHGVRQLDVAKALRTQQGNVSKLVGGSGTKRTEVTKGANAE